MKGAIFVMAAVGSLLALSGCGEPTVRISSSDGGSDGGPLRVVQTLQCPETMGGLTRKSVGASNGQSCTYGGPRGGEVELHLVALDGAEPRTRLAEFERDLRSLLPAAAAAVAPAPPEAPAAPSDERVDVRLPGLTIRTDGEKADVRLPGIVVSSEGDTSQVRVGGVDIQDDGQGVAITAAGGDGDVAVKSSDNISEVRVNAGGGATRSTYILSDSEPSPGGWRMVGYEARGPAGGPLVVATVRSRGREDDRLFDDAKDLVAHNVGE